MDCYYCIFYVAGLFLVFAYDDVSLHKMATQSHTYVGTGYDASKAVDGNTATCTRSQVIGSGSSYSYSTVWWKLDLGGVYNIYKINIQFRTYDSRVDRQKGRFAGFSLYVSNYDVLFDADIKSSTLCYKDGPQLPSLNFTTTCTEKGRYIIYYNERLKGAVYPEGYEVDNVYAELCEVTVQGCKVASFYGSNCEIPCPANCKDSTCHIQNGTCFTCTPGWIGNYCDSKCGQGWYGVNCNQQCLGHCRGGTTCNLVTGQCDEGCDVGWTGTFCDKECNDGTFGYDCKNNCSGHCLNNNPCTKQTGHCNGGCTSGYTNVFCDEICRPGYYGNGCGNLCNGYCLNNGICSHVNGVCVAGCQDGYIGKYCNNSCNKGYFGRNCSSVCSPQCKTCRHTDGHCSCFAGFTGYGCTTACFQSYGENCQKPCSQHCYNKKCDRFNGSCMTGCTDGFYGERCDKDIQMLRQDMSSSISWIVGLSVSLAINIILITSICVVCRGKHGRKGSISAISCWKTSDFYQDTNVTIDETSTYQELAVTLPKPQLLYHNTTLK